MCMWEKGAVAAGQDTDDIRMYASVKHGSMWEKCFHRKLERKTKLMKIKMHFIDSLKQDYVAKTREVNVYSSHIDFIHLKCIFYFFFTSFLRFVYMSCYISCSSQWNALEWFLNEKRYLWIRSYIFLAHLVIYLFVWLQLYAIVVLIAFVILSGILLLVACRRCLA